MRDAPTVLRAAIAGAAAAAVWAASEPALRTLFRTPFSDVRLLGRMVTSGRLWPVAGLAMHVANGAAFGVLFARLGGRGVRTAVLAAELENAALWPAMAIVDRHHPDRKDGSWPPLCRNWRVFVQEVVAHALFGAVLGSLLGRDHDGGTAEGPLAGGDGAGR